MLTLALSGKMSTDTGPISSPEDPSERAAGQTQSRNSDFDNGNGRTSGAGLFSLLLGTLGRPTSNLRLSLEEALRADATSDGTFSDEERSMLLRMLRYGALRVEDVMVPRADIIAADESDSVADVLRIFVEAGVSRIPLYHETLDDPRGILHVKDLLGCLVAEAEQNAEASDSNSDEPPDNSLSDQPPEVSSDSAVKRLELKGKALDFGAVDLRRSIGSLKVRRDVLFVPPSMPAMSLLIRMQSTRCHMALVVDEYGGTDGVVTIEDLVEQIVGDIDDEHDDDEAAHISEDVSQGLIASARTPVEDLEAHLGKKLLAEENEDDIDTIGGLVFSLVARVPSRGEIIPHPAGIEFEILDADPRRIKKVRVHSSGKGQELARRAS